MKKQLSVLLAILALAFLMSVGSLLAEDSTEVAADSAEAVAAPEEEVTTDSTAKAEEAEPEAPKHDYIGAKKCKICHKEQYNSWINTGHANAFELLKPEEKKNETCVVCHITGTTAKGEVLEGVQCESCHGPGADYRKTKIMKDKKLAMENGLIEPTAEVCEKCHNEKSPTFKGFDFEKSVNNPEGVHEHVKAEE